MRAASAYPSTRAARDRFVLARRPPRPRHDPWRHQGVLVEDERDPSGVVAGTATVFLTGRECPWRCLMCDLWRHTIEVDTPRGALVSQIDAALAALPRGVRQVKLYNAGSFFDPGAVPESDYEAIAARLAPFDRVIVESHPAFVGARTSNFTAALARAAGDRRGPGLEVAMGLETSHPAALARLNKGFTLDGFVHAAGWLRTAGVSLRVFLLVGVPFIPADEQDAWVARSVAFAFDCGAAAVSLIPTRTGNGALEALDFVPPALADLETALDRALARRPAGRVFADLWDLERFSSCPACLDARRDRLRSMNLSQLVAPPSRVRAVRGRMNPASLSVDVAIVGSGFAGSLTALALRRMGRSVALVERGRHPRFAIGESSTPLANLLVEELCDRYGLDRVRALSKWGTWQRSLPGVAGGLKRGFSFYRHDFDRPFEDGEAHDRQMLVAASPNDDIGDTHWYRPDVDHFLAREAQHAGAEYFDETSLTGFRSSGSGVVLEGARREQPFEVRARFVVDASGTRGFLHRALGLAEHPLRWLPPTQALFSHFTDVGWWDRTIDIEDRAALPFPVDLAALHHVFPGGWIWVLRFNNGITSAGAALTDPVAASIDVARDGAWERLLERLPSVQAQFRSGRATLPFVHSPRLAFRSAVVAGPNWALLPSAAGVIDPLLSTGFPLTLLGVHRLTRLFERPRWDDEAFARGLASYAAQTERELDATEQLVGAMYSSMGRFDRFKRLALLYFAAASYSETVRRLGMPEKARGFLLCDDPVFGPESRACISAAAAGAGDDAALFERIDRLIEPYDVAGLGRRDRRDWYPVLASDLIDAAPKLDAAPHQIEQLLERCGFRQTPAGVPGGN